MCKTPVHINISFLMSKDYGWQKCAQINACWMAVLMIDGPIWMYEYEVQSIAYYIVKKTYSSDP